MTSSLRRPAPRTSWRWARLAQAMSSTRPTAPNSASTAGRTEATTASPRGAASSPKPRVVGNRSRMRSPSRRSSWRACSSVTPRRRRPTALRK